MTVAYRIIIDEQRLAVETGEHVKIYNLERLVVTRRDATLILEPIALRPWPSRPGFIRCDLLANLKREQFILDWRLREPARADVRETLLQELELLPDVYQRKQWDERVSKQGGASVAAVSRPRCVGDRRSLDKFSISRRPRSGDSGYRASQRAAPCGRHGLAVTIVAAVPTHVVRSPSRFCKWRVESRCRDSKR